MKIVDYKEKLNIIIVPEILTSDFLGFNEKIVLSLHYTFSTKGGYSNLLSKDIAELLCLHKNIVSLCHKNLILLELIEKKGRVIRVTNKLKELKNLSKDKRTVLIPFEIYHTNIPAGAKLLWGEYNSLSKGKGIYFSKRETTAQRLGCNLESVTNWTKVLNKRGFLEDYWLVHGYGCNQKRVITKTFKRRN